MTPNDATPALRRFHEQGRRAWPQISLSLEALQAHLQGHGQADALEALVAEDLYLTCACVAGDPQALAAFERRYLAAVPGLVAQVVSGERAQEVQQRLRVKLLVQVGAEPPRIAAYSGRGALLAWLRVVALREAISLTRQSEGPGQRADRDLAALLPASDDPELQVIKAQHREVFQRALQEALRELSSEQRNLLRLYLVSELRSEQIAALYGVNRSTVVRWMAAARRDLWKLTRRKLGATLQLEPEEFNSLAQLLRSQLNLSLARVLQD